MQKILNKIFIQLSLPGSDADLGSFKLDETFEKGFLRKMMFHKTWGFIGQKKEALEKYFTADLIETVNGLREQNIIKNEVYSDFTEHLAEKIRFIPLKGVYYLKNIYKDDYSLRFMSDIDILLKLEDLLECAELLSAYGFNVPSDADIRQELQFRSHITLNGFHKKFPVSIELHTRPFETDISIPSCALDDPLFISTVHSVFHYYTDRFYHFSDWAYIKEKTNDTRSSVKMLETSGFLKNFKYLEKLENIFKKSGEVPYPFRNFIAKDRVANTFERFWFWYFIEGKVKTGSGYIAHYLKREKHDKTDRSC